MLHCAPGLWLITNDGRGEEITLLANAWFDILITIKKTCGCFE